MHETDDLDSLPQRVLAIDLGEKRVGLALSDPTGHFAVGLDTVQVSSQAALVTHLEALCKTHAVGEIVIGLPVNMDGSEGKQAIWVRDFAQHLQQHLSLPIQFLDERLTSKLAHQTLQAQGYQPSRPKVRQKGWVDQAAAKRIMQDYLDHKQFQANRERQMQAQTPDEQAHS